MYKKVSEKFQFLKPYKINNLKRYGAKHDGGYIVPEKELIESRGLLSFGYGYDVSFEIDYIKKTNNPVVIFDHTCGYEKLIFIFFKYLKRFLTFRKKIFIKL